MINNKTVLFDINSILRKITIEGGQKVAELGCGNYGFFLWPMAKLVGSRGVVYGVDILKETITEIKRRALKENFPQVKAVWSNLEIFKATQVETSCLDCALLVNVLHQSEKKVEIMREAVRLLKRNGKLLVVEWSTNDIAFGPETNKRVKLESILSVAPKIGLEVKESFIAGPYHYGVILVKI